KRDTGEIAGTGDTWSAIDQALIKGSRGLQGGDSLARLLARERGTRNIRQLPPLTEEQILAWAEAYRAERGTYPTRTSGAIADAPPGETWGKVAAALEQGLRSLRRWTSLQAFLRACRGAPSNREAQLQLSEEIILQHARAYNQENPGHWPND